MAKKRVEVKKYNGIKIGTWADTVLETMPRSEMTSDPVPIGMDQDGVVAEWHYPDVIFTMARASKKFPKIGEITAYAVQRIEEIIEKGGDTK